MCYSDSDFDEKPRVFGYDDSNFEEMMFQKEDEFESNGVKYDDGKLQYGLLPTKALKGIVEILTFGAQKYSPNNWRKVPDQRRRYFDAAQRHLWAWKDGEENDPESRKNHLAHALCCLMFLLEKDLEKTLDN